MYAITVLLNELHGRMNALTTVMKWQDVWVVFLFFGSVCVCACLKYLAKSVMWWLVVIGTEEVYDGV